MSIKWKFMDWLQLARCSWKIAKLACQYQRNLYLVWYQPRQSSLYNLIDYLPPPWKTFSKTKLFNFNMQSSLTFGLELSFLNSKERNPLITTFNAHKTYSHSWSISTSICIYNYKKNKNWLWIKFCTNWENWTFLWM
jgi:hypothetical protein